MLIGDLFPRKKILYFLVFLKPVFFSLSFPYRRYLTILREESGFDWLFLIPQVPSQTHSIPNTLLNYKKEKQIPAVPQIIVHVHAPWIFTCKFPGFINRHR